MKSVAQIRQMGQAAVRRHQLAEMRRAAMDYRISIAPETCRNLVERGQNGLFALELAISYRDLARDLGRWATMPRLIEPGDLMDR